MQPNGPTKMTLIEIGPRFVLTPIRIFEGAFGGATVFLNPGDLLYPLKMNPINVVLRIYIPGRSAFGIETEGRRQIQEEEGCAKR